MKDLAFLIAVLIAFPMGALAFILTLSTAAYPQADAGFSPWVDSRGNIHLPTGFRSGWVHLGSWFVEGANGDSSFHDVYTEQESASHFREHQAFPDGATLVKEVRSSRSGTMTTGQAQWAEETAVWFVMIKDTRGRFGGNPLWGDGWGWALFEADHPSATVTKDYAQECRSCHVPARQTDWVYVQGYPTLGLASKTEVAPAMEAQMAGDPEDPSAGPVVTIQDLSFAPKVIRIKPGQTITWVNRDEFAHTATADDKSFDTGTIAPGEQAQVAFETAGTYPYYCTPHPFMKATVIVE